jgi:hypothetical protein
MFRARKFRLALIPVGLTHNLSVVMPALCRAPTSFAQFSFARLSMGVDGRDIRAFTPVFAGYARP